MWALYAASASAKAQPFFKFFANFSILTFVNAVFIQHIRCRRVSCELHIAARVVLRIFLVSVVFLAEVIFVCTNTIDYKSRPSTPGIATRNKSISVRFHHFWNKTGKFSFIAFEILTLSVPVG